MDREALSKQDPLEPSTPEEYLEAIRRFVKISFQEWENLPDGDGVNVSPDDQVTTKTDMFKVIGGCTCYALDLLHLKHQVDG